ncbi:hypothetical protein PIB30_074721 [Stylosanthes scabra]|uniref:Ubiquitin-like protease family profile domain-containing protein n=1 Tax=Stylosanthes scabra TaxID=79078 RepID=A0ABU6TPI2_9FABA|nr:hypothetical protein [Stylosanthes scabra]
MGQELPSESQPDPSVPSFSLGKEFERPLGTQEQPPKTPEEELSLTARTIIAIESLDEHVSEDGPQLETPQPTQVVSLMCYILNAEENERFEKLVYCIPPEILQRMFETHHHNCMDKKKKKHHEISTLKNHQEYLVYLDKEKLVSHRFWMYVLDVAQREIFVLNSKNIVYPSDERTALSKFAVSFVIILDQMLIWTGAPSMFKKGSHSLLPKYIDIPGQPNEFDCAVFVMKWMELIDPTILAGCCKDNTTYEIEQWTDPMLEEFRKKIVIKIIMSKENSLRAEANSFEYVQTQTL